MKENIKEAEEVFSNENMFSFKQKLVECLQEKYNHHNLYNE
jgi:hypothetical protein